MIEGVEWRRLFSLYEAAHQGISAMRTIQRSCVGGGSVVELTLMEQFKTDAERCRTPKQFRDLVKQLQDVLPYQSFICSWGYVEGHKIGFIYHNNFPTDYLRWWLTKGMAVKSPLIREWFRTKRVQIWTDVAHRFADGFTPEHRERVIKSGLQHSVSGGWIGRELYVFCGIVMPSEESCRASVKPFRLLLPSLCKALKQACPRPLLTQREITILERRVMGEAIKHIAAEEGIARRTVTMHLQRVKKKLYTDDLVNAIVIAVRAGMIDESWKGWHVSKSHHRFDSF